VPAAQLCARRFAAAHPQDAARLLEQSPAAEAAPFLSELPAVDSAQVLSQMSLAPAAETLSLMGLQQAAALTDRLPFDSAAALLRRLDPERSAGLIAVLSEERRAYLERLLEYAAGTVGAVTDPEVLAIPSDLTIEDAQRLLKKRAGLFHHQLYVVDRDRRLLGFLHVRELLRAPAKAPVTSAMSPAAVRLRAKARLSSSLSHPAWAEIDAIPVVDDAGVLLGIVRHRQLRRLQSTATTGGVTGALLGLSELYWIGLSAFLPGGGTPAGSQRGAAAQQAGGKNAR